MENLTKHQIVLLTLLISFVTSMATGIVAVSLMNQAPAGVTQTINRVVERTIEKVVTQPSTSTVATVGTITKETIVVSADDKVVSAIDKNSKSLLRIYKSNVDPFIAGTESLVFVGIGAVISDDGIVATDANIVSQENSRYFTSPDGKLHELLVLRSEVGDKVGLLKIKEDSKNPLNLQKADLSKNDLKLGQSVVYIGGETKNIVATGIVSGLGTGTLSIETSISQNVFISGGLLLNLSGELVGVKAIYLGNSNAGLFAPSAEIQKALDSLAKSSDK